MNQDLLQNVCAGLDTLMRTRREFLIRRLIAVEPANAASASWSAAQSAALHRLTNAAALMEAPTTKAELRSALQNLADVRTFQPEADAIRPCCETVWKRKSQSS